MDGDDLVAELASFAFEKFIGSRVAKLGKIPNLAYEIYKETTHVFEISREGTLSTNNETNIFTNQSKETQKNTVGAYSRAAGFMPTQDIILSADENSYAEFITVLNDTNYKSRLT